MSEQPEGLDPLEVLSGLPQKEQAEYREWIRGFESPFWALLKSGIADAAQGALSRQLSAQSWDQVLKARGELQALGFLSSLEEQIHDLYASMLLARGEE